MNTIIAIDPGKSGGIAVRSGGVTDCMNMPATEGDLVFLLREIKATADNNNGIAICVLEIVNGFVGKEQPGSRMFKFGENYGFVKGVVQTLGIRLVTVRPQDWQKWYGLGTAKSCATRTIWKNKLKAEAQRRFPQLKVTLNTADALLILEHFAYDADTKH